MSLIQRQASQNSRESSQQSSQSVLSSGKLNLHLEQNQRQSAVNEKYKKVVLWTQVIIGNKFTKQAKPQKFEYHTTRKLYQVRIPQVCKDLHGGLVLDLPNTNIQEQLNNIIDVVNFESDDALVKYLENLYNDIREKCKYVANPLSHPILKNEIFENNDNFNKLTGDTLNQFKVDMQNIIESNHNNALKQKPLKRREQKQIDKYDKIIQHYFQDNMQPKTISRLLNIQSQLVYKVVQKVKYENKQEHKRQKQEQPLKQQYSDNHELLNLIQDQIQNQGIYNIQMPKLKEQLEEQVMKNYIGANIKIPSTSILNKIVKENFNLKYGVFESANLKYQDPQFNEKRQWIARLLAQFMFEDFLIITIDESNFRSDTISQKQWMFNKSVIAKQLNQQINQQQAKNAQITTNECDSVYINNNDMIKQQMTPSQNFIYTNINNNQYSDTIVKHMSHMQFLSPKQQYSTKRNIVKFYDDTIIKSYNNLSPIIESDDEYYTTNKKKTAQDDFIINTMMNNQSIIFDDSVNQENIEIQNFEEVKSQKSNDSHGHIHSNIDTQRKLLNSKLGKYGAFAHEMTLQKQPIKRQQYSLSLLSAMSQNKIIATQIIEGAIDSTLFDNFVYRTLHSVRSNIATQNMNVIVFMDNAVIHKHSQILETCRAFKCNILFNAQYSPWLNPVEQLFGHLKRNIKTHQANSKKEIVESIARNIKSLKESDVQMLWLFSIKSWIQTLTYGNF